MLLDTEGLFEFAPATLLELVPGLSSAIHYNLSNFLPEVVKKVCFVCMNAAAFLAIYLSHPYDVQDTESGKAQTSVTDHTPLLKTEYATMKGSNYYQSIYKERQAQKEERYAPPNTPVLEE